MHAKLRLAAAAAILALSGMSAGAADILKSCASDIGQYCSAVEAGNGRMLSCLYAHELVISDECDAAMGDAADILDTMFASMRTVMEACSGDIYTLCQDVAPGEGRIFSCLINNRDALSESCGGMMSLVKMPGQQ